VPLPIQLDYDRGVPVYRQIYDAVLSALASGELGSDEQLPTIHDLASRLEVNPNTVARAYRELEADKYIFSRRGRGSFPAATAPPRLPDRKKILRTLFREAVTEAARHRISPEEMVETFRRMLCET
jgi:GntR family transcriptional regulator